jgi:hypothetical protein
MSELSERFETHEAGEKQVAEKIRCDACPVMCYIAEGRSGACDRYGNVGGRIVRLDPLTILEQRAETGGEAVAFDAGQAANLSTRGNASSPRSAQAPPIPTTSRRPSSSARRSRASIW